MSNKGQTLQDPFLNALRKEHIPVLLRNTVTQMVYKHAISTVVPARAVSLPTEAAAVASVDEE